MDSCGEALVRGIFDETVPVIHSVLVSYYRFMEEEAQAFEGTLFVWFLRAARRLGSHQAPHSQLREQLLFVACKYARSLQIARFRGVEPSQEDFTMVLARPPEEVALELVTKLELGTTHA